MTTLATLTPPLKRLFERIDAGASTATLRTALDHWREARGAGLLPAAQDLALPPGPAAERLFVLSRCEDGADDWEVVSGGAGATALAAPKGEWPRLGAFGNRRLAVRLRRLLDVVRESAEPVVASYSEAGAAGDTRFELLVAPLSSDHRAVDGALVGVVTR